MMVGKMGRKAMRTDFCGFKKWQKGTAFQEPLSPFPCFSLTLRLRPQANTRSRVYVGGTPPGIRTRARCFLEWESRRRHRREVSVILKPKALPREGDLHGCLVGLFVTYYWAKASSRLRVDTSGVPSARGQ